MLLLLLLLLLLLSTVSTCTGAGTCRLGIMLLLLVLITRKRGRREPRAAGCVPAACTNQLTTVAHLPMTDKNELLAVHNLLARLSSLPPGAEPEEAASFLDQGHALSASKLLVFTLARLVQTLVVEVEAGRSALLDTQAALASVLNRMQYQHANFTTAQESAETMERSVNELAQANARLRYQLIQRHPLQRAGRVQLSAAERKTLEVEPADWQVRRLGQGSIRDGGCSLSSEVGLLTELSDTVREQSIARLVVAGSRPPSATTSRAHVAQSHHNSRTLQRQGEWELAGSGGKASATPADGDGSSWSAAECANEQPKHLLGSSDLISSPSRALPVGLAWHESGGSRPWSKRAEELRALRPPRSDAAATAASASTAAVMASAHQTTAYMQEHMHDGGVAASPSHAKFPAWRATQKPFACSFSTGSLRGSSNVGGVNFYAASQGCSAARPATPLNRCARVAGMSQPRPFAHTNRPDSATKDYQPARQRGYN